MTKRQNHGEQCKIVQNYVKAIDDPQQRLVCFYILENYDDAFIRKTMKLSKEKLEAIKLKIAWELRQAGVRDS